MRARSCLACLRTAGSALLLAAPLALSLPGVEVSRADPAPRIDATADEGAVCRVDDDPSQPRRNAEALGRLQQRLQAELAAEPGEAVVLDGRGYGYHPPSNVAAEIELLRREAAARSRPPR